jgi:hypothetical protein
LYQPKKKTYFYNMIKISRKVKIFISLILLLINFIQMCKGEGVGENDTTPNDNLEGSKPKFLRQLCSTLNEPCIPFIVPDICCGDQGFCCDNAGKCTDNCRP